MSEKKLSIFTIIYFGVLPYIFLFVDSIFIKSTLNILWNFIYNTITLVILAATLFLITLNNPVKRHMRKPRNLVRIRLFKFYNKISWLITLVAPHTVINHKSLTSMLEMYKSIFNNNIQYHMHASLFEIIIIILITSTFPILYLNASVLSSEDKRDNKELDSFIEKQIEHFE